ncbi:MAG TPA: mannonate dehydratase [Mucilaginibacter sp.]|jgi:mannonate dehydratase|nr:mannonate dehydratase [Mucilaginibacter sp.]
MKDNRRDFIKKGTSLAAALSLGAVGASALPLKTNEAAGAASPLKVKWPILEGPDTPYMTMNMPAIAWPITREKVRRLKQAGADHSHCNGPKEMPWTEQSLREFMAPFEAEGVKLCNIMVNDFPNTIFGREGRDQEIENIKASIIAAGKVGIPVIEYNFYAHRLGEAYYDVPGRGGAGYSAYDWNRPTRSGVLPKDLTPRPGEPAMKAEQLWDNLTYFLKAIIPVAEKAGVRMALHPNDPPAPVSRGSEQIMKSFADWKRLLAIVNSPSNGMTFDCGVTTEIGEDPVAVIRYMAARDRINHVHYRNCIVTTPSTKYVETFPDNGQVDMYAVMRELFRVKYRFGIFAEHPRVLDYDHLPSSYGEYAGYLYNMAYARAMFQAVIYNGF